MKVIAEQKISANIKEEMARFAKALAHPTRLEILRLLSTQSCCFTGELTEMLPIAQSTVSQHLKELKMAGLIQGEINPPKTRYCINQENWRKAKLMFLDFFKYNE
ncbi:MAG: winged helix-turn-helix transcriptional regulator [Saprospiraceae bacterium]|nr:metalloregulator ArsR/SmtB family transcription factor [Bacteroidia bacterium]NNK89993.1 winged helix-turn-helix transcriptional regulator [Saprospiraceae bacterium]